MLKAGLGYSDKMDTNDYIFYDFQARDIYEEAIETVLTVRDFTPLKWISVYSSLSFFFFKGDAFPFISDFLFFGFVAFSFIITCVLSFLRSINLVPFPTFLMFRTEVHSTWWRYNRQTSGESALFDEGTESAEVATNGWRYSWT